jgi:hypothetical protein
VKTRNAGMTACAVAVALLLTACGGGSGGGGTGDGGGDTPTPAARPSSPATLRIVAPANGAVVHGSTVRVRVSLSGGTIVPATTKDITPTTGHLHLSLDGKLISMNYQAHQTIPNVAPGQHVLQVEFVAADHLPFDPRVIAAVAFTVQG